MEVATQTRLASHHPRLGKVQYPNQALLAPSQYRNCPPQGLRQQVRNPASNAGMLALVCAPQASRSRRSPVLLRAVIPIALACALASCGGGGGGGMAAVRTPPTIDAFAASPEAITTGQSSTLTWSVAGATSVSISGIGSVTGDSIEITPVADTDYVLTVSNDVGTAQARASVTVYPEPHYWFAPDGARIDPDYGSVDYFDLFTPDAPWAEAASHIQVFKIYAETLDLDVPATQLENLFAELKRRHIAVAIEFGPLQAENDVCGIGVEGFGGAAGLHYARRIRDLGGVLQYVAFDEPFFFGSMYDGPSACHWTADQVAQNAAAHVADIKSVFPHVIVGDIEVMPVASVAPDWIDRYEDWGTRTG